MRISTSHNSSSTPECKYGISQTTILSSSPESCLCRKCQFSHSDKDKDKANKSHNFQPKIHFSLPIQIPILSVPFRQIFTSNQTLFIILKFQIKLTVHNICVSEPLLVFVKANYFIRGADRKAFLELAFTEKLIMTYQVNILTPKLVYLYYQNIILPLSTR